MHTITLYLLSLALLLLPFTLSAQYLIQIPEVGSDKITEISCDDTDMDCEIGFVTWADGRTYEGALKDGLPHGEGKMVWSDAVYYRGHFEKGKRHGYGKFVNKKTVYDGDWQNDYIGDQGAAVFDSGDEYLGAFLGGLIHGKGTMRFSNGALYSGDWQNGMPHGTGTLVRTDKSTYTGNFVEGMREGEGVVSWNTGDTFTGSWINDYLNGKATYMFVNEDRLITEWRNGWLSNEVVYQFKNGKLLEGTLQQVKEAANLEISNILKTETNFQLALIGMAMELKSARQFELANNFLLMAQNYATTEEQRYDLIDGVINEVENLQKTRGLANLPDQKAE